MPQFDGYSFIIQCISVMLAFGGLYLFLTQNFILVLTRSFKLRQRLYSSTLDYNKSKMLSLLKNTTIKSFI
jgi:hypothetical protein